MDIFLYDLSEGCGPIHSQICAEKGSLKQVVDEPCSPNTTQKETPSMDEIQTMSCAPHLRATLLKNELLQLTRLLCKEFERDLTRNVKSNLKGILAVL